MGEDFKNSKIPKVKIVTKGGEGSGWFGPPEGTHTSEVAPSGTAGFQGVANLERAREEAQKEGLQKLRDVKTLDEIWALNTQLDEHSLAFYSKRSGRGVIDFQPHFNPKKVIYLYDDGFSKGTARFENLSKILTIR